MKKIIYILLLIGSFLTSSFAPPNKPLFGVRTVVIDPGHGGKDPGCHGSKYKEKDIALAVALKLGSYIEEHMKDVKVVYTRKTDVFVDLQERAEIANREKADLFICIHCNSACVRDKKLKKDVCNEEALGAETYVMGIKNEQGKLDIAARENSAILLEDNYVKKYNGFDPNSTESYIIMSMFNDTYLTQSLNFAYKLQQQYSKKAGRVDKGVKRASLWVLWRTYMPSVLTEIGFLTHPEEEQFLGSTSGQDFIASGIFRAFREYKDELEGSIKKYEDTLEIQVPYKISKEDSTKLEENKKNKISSAGIAGQTKEVKADSKPPIKKDAKTDAKTEIKIDLKTETVPPPLKNDTSAKEEKKEVLIEKIKPDVKTVPKQEAALTIVYKVQVLSSDKKIPFTSEKLKNIEKPGFYIDKGVYKYTSGEFSDHADALKLQVELQKKGFKDAFVIATQDGKRITQK